MGKLLSTRKRIVITASVAIVVLGAVAAFAYFSSSGNGSGTASVGNSTGFHVTSDDATGGPLTPGGDDTTYESVAYHVNNPSTGYQNLNQVVVSVAKDDGSTWLAPDPLPSTNTNAQCSASDFQLSVDGGTTWADAGDSATDTAIAADLAPGGTADGAVVIRMVDSGANQDNCQGVTVPLYFSAS